MVEAGDCSRAGAEETMEGTTAQGLHERRTRLGDGALGLGAAWMDHCKRPRLAEGRARSSDAGAWRRRGHVVNAVRIEGCYSNAIHGGPTGKAMVQVNGATGCNLLRGMELAESDPCGGRLDLVILIPFPNTTVSQSALGKLRDLAAERHGRERLGG